MPTDLNIPITEGGLRRIPFFNGRVLTAEDLETEQNANAVERKRLGHALGTGVVEGLFVDRVDDGSDDPPTTVTVEPGLALAPSGRVLELPSGVELSVVSEIDREATAGTKGQFAGCSAREVVMTSGTGPHVLFAEPASEPEGRTPRTRPGGDGSAGECGAQHFVEGAQLRLVPLDTGDPDLVPESLQTERGERLEIEDKLDGDADSREKHVSKLRNILAHVCLRTPLALTETVSLYDTIRRQARGERSGLVGSDGPLDVLRQRVRTPDGGDDLDDAVPLGLLYWSGDRIVFVDVWSVRRRVHRPDPQRPVPATARRRAETEAAIFQFQDHLVDLRQRLGFSERVRLSAENGFLYLPPFGTIPNEEGDRAGFDVYSFFDTLSTREYLYVEGTTLRNLVSEATQFDSFRTDTNQLVWRYRVREDVQSGDDKHPSFVAFTSGFVPHAAEPQYNLSRFGYATYGPGVALR
jgi:hypothetical protein